VGLVANLQLEKEGRQDQSAHNEDRHPISKMLNGSSNRLARRGKRNSGM
jgi:hypothetical protein